MLLAGATAFVSAASAASAGLATSDYKIDTADAHYNLETGAFDMPRHVRFYRPGTDGSADSASGNSKNGTVTLRGNVVIHDSGGAVEVSSDRAYRGSGPATITCASLAVNARAKTYDATGNVHFSQGGRTGSADHALLDRGRGVLHMDGNVRLSDNGSTITTSTLDYNLNTKDVNVHGAPSVITQPKQ